VAASHKCVARRVQDFGQLWKLFLMCGLLNFSNSFRFSIAGLAFIVHLRLRWCTSLQVARFQALHCPPALTCCGGPSERISPSCFDTEKNRPDAVFTLVVRSGAGLMCKLQSRQFIGLSAIRLRTTWLKRFGVQNRPWVQ
jgi:hypothetical protein